MTLESQSAPTKSAMPDDAPVRTETGEIIPLVMRLYGILCTVLGVFSQYCPQTGGGVSDSDRLGTSGSRHQFFL